MRLHVLLQALRARAAVREEGLVVLRRRQLRAHARAHLAQQLDAARRDLVLALRYHLRHTHRHYPTTYTPSIPIGQSSLLPSINNLIL